MKNTSERRQDAEGDDNPMERSTINNNNNNDSSPPAVVSLIAKPSPPASLNDLEEAGRIRLTVHFGQQYQQDNVVAGMPVKQVTARITNNSRARSAAISLPRMATTSHVGSNTGAGENVEESVIPHSSSAAELVQKGLDTWYGEIAIPCNWFEGGSKTFERTGSFTPYYDDNLFTMTISWALLPRNNSADKESKRSALELHSTDAFHWEQQE